MRAVLFDEPAVDARATRIAELPVPEPGPGQVSIDVVHAGVNFKDVMARRGDPGYVTSWPFVPGLEVAGRVRQVGPGVPDRRAGEPVVAFTETGGLAEVALAPAALTVELPAGLDPEIAAGAPGALVSAALLLGDIGRLRPADSLLLHGAAGGVGQAVLGLAHLLGAGPVLGTVGSASRRAAAEQLGYDTVVVREPGWAEVLRRRHPQGIDLVLDPQGTELLDDDVELAAPGGRIVLFGNAGGRPLGALPAPGTLFGRNLSVAGFSLAAMADSAPLRVAEALRQTLRYLASEQLSLEITRIPGLDGVPAAQQALADGHGRGKQIVRVADVRWPGADSAGRRRPEGVSL